MDQPYTWHTLDPNDASTYPTVNGLVQVKYSDGRMEQGECRKFFRQRQFVAVSDITSWRYMRDRTIS